MDARAPLRRGRVELVAGPKPRLATETQSLLRSRLRLAVLVLLLSCAFFVVRRFVGLGSTDPASSMASGYQLFVFIVLLICAGLLWGPWLLGLFELRLVELAVFGVPCALFFLVHFGQLNRAARENDPQMIRYACQVCSQMWFALVLIYGTFIPNTLRRALLVMGAMSLAPLGIIGWSGYQHANVGAMVFRDTLPVVAITMGVAFSTAVYGSYKIGALRREAFEARRLGQYRLTERLGSGGMGEVFLAEHMLLKRPCAVKVIRGGATAPARALIRFEREVRAIARLTHWNSVEIFDYGRADDGTFYYAMEYLPGMSLQEVVERQGPMQPERVVHLVRQVCDALYEAHALGLVHRDIKPANIIASKRGGVCDVAKLLDFGLATSLVEHGDLEPSQDGSVVGSPLYMAPERYLENDEPDARSDIYSLGAVMYFLLTGQPPFQSTNALQVMMAHARQPLTPPSQVHPQVPRDIEAIVLRCMAKGPEDRFKSVAELADALGCCQAAGEWSQQSAVRCWLPSVRDEMAAAQTGAAAPS